MLTNVVHVLLIRRVHSSPVRKCGVDGGDEAFGECSIIALVITLTNVVHVTLIQHIHSSVRSAFSIILRSIEGVTLGMGALHVRDH